MQQRHEATGSGGMPAVAPTQPTIISRKTARTLAYLEIHGLADFSSCNLAVMLVRGPKDHKERQRYPHTAFPHRLAV